uniref:C2H2-type domain-containing protein n=1 Tax=Oryzias latipes TaxID=8090 RepID=A0A3P9JAP9_ORYLA
MASMDGLETPYEEDLEFIQCTVCEKSLKGESLFKIHLTTPAHLKKEHAVVASGQAVRQKTVPKFTDIIKYLDYLQLDEPIIGLSCLEEVPNPDPQLGPKFMCRLCKHPAILTDMVCHVIGRKHRQKYVEAKRPDLVTWDYKIQNTQAGKIMRAKAEIIERQDGRGYPQIMKRRGVEGKLNILRIPPSQRQSKEQSIPRPPTVDVPPLLPEFADFNNRKRSWDYPNAPGLHPDADANRDRPFQREAVFSQHRPADELQRGASLSKYREWSMNPDYHAPYDGQYVQDPQRRSLVEPLDRPVYDNREPYGQGHDYQSEAASSYNRPYPERDPLEEFYAEEVRRGKSSHEYQTPHQGYTGGDQQRWSLERESGQHGGLDRAGRRGSSEPEAKRRNVSAAMEGEGGQDQLFNIVKDYHHEMRYLHQERSFDKPGQSREESPGAPVATNISNIPEPFKRFLTGGVMNEGLAKRKSRFSDATPEELEMTGQMFQGASRPSYSAAREEPRPMRAEQGGAKYSGHYGESRTPHHKEGYHQGSSESEGVFDMLKNVEIEDSEEAEFLKSKLATLMKEFQAKKREKGMAPGPHERNTRESFDHTRLEDPAFGSGHRRGWNQREHMPEEHYQAHRYPAHEEPQQSVRTRYEDELASYPERFQEPIRPSEYQPGVGESRNSGVPPLFMEEGSRRLGDPSYSKNLDKITSALLELVARK